MTVIVRQAETADAPLVSSILHEAAGWLRELGTPLWRESELDPGEIETHVAEGLYYLFEAGGEAAGTFRFQLSDPDFWPDIVQEESAFLHRLAIRRRFAGGQLSSAMLSAAVQLAKQRERRYLRLDCEAARPRLRGIYEAFGFRHHSDRQVGPFFVARYELDLREIEPGPSIP